MEEPVGNVADPGATPEGTTQGTTDAGTKGQSTTPDQTTASGPDSGADSFFDPESIKGKPELEAAYKQMQSAYTKKSQEFAKARDKISQYDEFMKDPVTSMKQLAQQMGWQLVQGQPESKDGKPKSYETWDDVFADAKKQVMEELKPFIGELQNMKKQSIESYLDNNFADWRTYEDQMMEKLQAHPSLVSDPDTLYRISVPPEVMEARMMKKAQQKLQGAAQASTVQGQSATTKQTSQKPKGKMSFDEAVQFAKQQLASRGLTAPREL